MSSKIHEITFFSLEIDGDEDNDIKYAFEVVMEDTGAINVHKNSDETVNLLNEDRGFRPDDPDRPGHKYVIVESSFGILNMIILT